MHLTGQSTIPLGHTISSQVSNVVQVSKTILAQSKLQIIYSEGDDVATHVCMSFQPVTKFDIWQRYINKSC